MAAPWGAAGSATALAEQLLEFGVRQRRVDEDAVRQVALDELVVVLRVHHDRLDDLALRHALARKQLLRGAQRDDAFPRRFGDRAEGELRVLALLASYILSRPL